MFVAASRIRQSHLDLIRRLGVTPAALAEMNLLFPAVGIVEAEPIGEGLWQPAEGPAHLVQPVLVDGAVVDLVAWRSIRPDAWRLRTGAAWVLGEDLLRVHGSWGNDQALRVYATPLDWLAGTGDGVCVLDWSSSEVRSLLNIREIEVSSKAFGDILLREVTKPLRMPRIRVRRRSDVA